MKKSFLILVSCSTLLSPQAQIFFDDFDINEGHFGFSPTFTDFSLGVGTASADRITDLAPFEGKGHQKIDFTANQNSPLKIRHLSGGPPYDLQSGGNPAFNIPFTTTSGPNGNIGFFLRTDMVGLETLIALDSPSNAQHEMYGSISTPIIGDAQWHFYEWNLDDAVWAGVPGMVNRPVGTLPNNTYTIDAIYFRDPDGLPSSGGIVFLDLVALNPTGSLAVFAVPEPATYGLASALVLAGFAAFRRLNRKQH